VGKGYVLTHREPVGISVINKKGSLTDKVGSSGRGPFEWLLPSKLQKSDGQVYIWDANNLKYLVYNDAITPKTELRGIKHSVSGFSVSHENDLIATYHNPTTDNNFIKIYERKDKSELKMTRSLGNLSDEGRILMFNAFAGGILWVGHELIWVDPASPELIVYDFEKDEVKYFKFDDEHFKVEDWNYEIEASQKTFQRIRDYIFSNSRIVSLQKLMRHILVEVEHFVDNNSVIYYHIFDFNYEHIGKIKYGEGGWENYIRGIDQNRLIFWGEDYNETGQMNSMIVRELIIR
jgi:hypothetical protein